MKNKVYLNCVVTRHDGTTFENPLKRREAYLISRLAQNNRSVKVTLRLCTHGTYKSIFG